MQQIIYFFQKFKYFLFYLLLAFIAIALTLNNLNFHKSKYVNSANSITGGLYSKSSNISEYFSLKSENELLSIENTKLRNQLQKYKSINDSVIEKVIIDSSNFQQKYSFINAKIIKNDFTNPFNFITINRGKNNGVKHEMAVINSKGIIGITDNSKNKYARVQSILNKNSKINARLKNSFYFGTLTWDGKDYKIVQLLDIPRQAPIKVGDTIETGGKSTIFPEGIPIGTITKINIGNTADNKIDIKLFNDMSNLGYVYVIKSLDKIEIKSLENLVDE
ncbi:rod shape-determining protein MreC [Polaribacter sargassicola]|uniref:rod shape-determining protein MreC n=1 Tax=Polaribacter sargassicola TaxID=2836891 RepID=UPI001F2F5225|nr:rod shape-determining protein MreC [Polaribacter sp. DS7-9]MCG1035903.1 rod shape-determining protein MreC [Polaribacter sp. DS7-9]